jgi:hypothetical protein
LDSVPSSVRILGKTYSICSESIPSWAIAETYYKGRVYHNAQQIIYDKNLNIESQWETILHEIVHAIDHACGFGFSEIQVTGLSAALFSLVVDNNSMFRSMISQPAMVSQPVANSSVSSETEP